MAAVPRFVRENEELVEASLRTTYSGQVEEEMIINHDDPIRVSVKGCLLVPLTLHVLCT